VGLSAVGITPGITGAGKNWWRKNHKLPLWTRFCLKRVEEEKEEAKSEKKAQCSKDQQGRGRVMPPDLDRGARETDKYPEGPKGKFGA